MAAATVLVLCAVLTGPLLNISQRHIAPSRAVLEFDGQAEVTLERARVQWLDEHDALVSPLATRAFQEARNARWEELRRLAADDDVGAVDALRLLAEAERGSPAARAIVVKWPAGSRQGLPWPLSKWAEEIVKKRPHRSAGSLWPMRLLVLAGWGVLILAISGIWGASRAESQQPAPMSEFGREVEPWHLALLVCAGVALPRALTWYSPLGSTPFIDVPTRDMVVIGLDVVLAGLALKWWSSVRLAGSLSHARIWALVACAHGMALGLAFAPFLVGIRTESQALLGRSLPWVWAMLAKHCLTSPLFEEVLFTAGLFGLLARSLDWRKAALITGMGFALIHADWHWIQLIRRTVVGIVACWAYRRTGSLAVPLAAHVFHNALCYARAGAIMEAAGSPWGDLYWHYP